MTTAIRKPRIALMGEFSSGKSTLSNLLIGARSLPEKVTATRLSPVWISHGRREPYRVDIDGSEAPVSIDELETISVETTRVIRLFFESDLLETCDLIDFPGISDPNMSSDVWQRVLDEVDMVLWCTHATQAWRQSEAAVWETIPQAVRARSILLVTRFDKVRTPRDQQRVLARLKKETQGLFGATFPISLTRALAAGGDEDAFERSGARDFLDHFGPLITDLGQMVGSMSVSLYQSEMGTEDTTTVAPARPDQTDPQPQASGTDDSSESETPEAAPDHDLPSAAPDQDPVNDTENQDDRQDDTPRIIPRRVSASGGSSRSTRPKALSGVQHFVDGGTIRMRTDEIDLIPQDPAVREVRSVFHEQTEETDGDAGETRKIT